MQIEQYDSGLLKNISTEVINKIHDNIRTEASPGTFFTVSGTVRMVPAEDLKVHIGSKQRVDIVYYHLALNKQPTVERTNSNRFTDSMKLHIP